MAAGCGSGGLSQEQICGCLATIAANGVGINCRLEEDAPSLHDMLTTCSGTGSGATAQPATPTPALCIGDRVAWDGGYGGCASYRPGLRNHPYCSSDADAGITGSQACSECGGCVDREADSGNVGSGSGSGSGSVTCMADCVTIPSCGNKAQWVAFYESECSRHSPSGSSSGSGPTPFDPPRCSDVWDPAAPPAVASAQFIGTVADLDGVGYFSGGNGPVLGGTTPWNIYLQVAIASSFGALDNSSSASDTQCLATVELALSSDSSINAYGPVIASDMAGKVDISKGGGRGGPSEHLCALSGLSSPTPHPFLSLFRHSRISFAN